MRNNLKNAIKSGISNSLVNKRPNLYQQSLLETIWYYSTMGYTFTQEYISESESNMKGGGWHWKVFYNGQLGADGMTPMKENYEHVINGCKQHNRNLIIDTMIKPDNVYSQQVINKATDDFLDF